MRLIILLLLSFQLAYAQETTLKGKVTDNTDGLPLQGAIVEIVSLHKYASTSDKGEFVFNNIPTGNYILKITLLGYTSEEIRISMPKQSGQRLEVSLHQSIEDLETVVVTGTRSEKKLKDVPVLTQVIHPEQLTLLGITTVEGALQHEVPGLDVAQFNYRPRVTFQGMNAKYVLFLVDGERIAGEMNGDIDYYRLNLSNVERIEVVRGASSALYGSNAMGGVINIITKKPVLPIDINSHIRYSKFNDMSAGTTFTSKKQLFSSNTSISYNQTDGYDIDPNDETITQEKFKNATINQKLVWEPFKKISFIANGNLFYSRIYDAATIPADHAYSGFGGYFKSIYSVNDSFELELTYSADDYKNYLVFVNNNDKHSKTAYDFQQCSRLIGKYKTSIGHFIAGIEYKPEEIYSTRITNEIRKANEMIAFLQHDYTFLKQYSIVLGIRTTRHSMYGYNHVPKVSFMANLRPVIVRASYGMGFRSPTLKEMYYNFDHLGMFTLLGNENLKPEQSHYFGLSFEYIFSKINVSLNMFHHRVKDMISGVWLQPRVNQYINISSAKIWGLDFMGKIKPVRSLNLSCGLSLVNAKNNETGKQIYDISPVSANITLGYIIEHKKSQTSFELFGKFNGRRFYEPVGEITYEDPPFNTWKLSVSERFKNNINLTLGIDNLFNTVNAKSFDNISPGRRLFVMLSYNFRKY